MKDLTIIPPIGKLLDREHVKIEKGHVVHKYKLDNRFANRNNVITGGILSTALDCYVVMRFIQCMIINMQQLNLKQFF